MDFRFDVFQTNPHWHRCFCACPFPEYLSRLAVIWRCTQDTVPVYPLCPLSRPLHAWRPFRPRLGSRHPSNANRSRRHLFDIRFATLSAPPRRPFCLIRVCSGRHANTAPFNPFCPPPSTAALDKSDRACPSMFRASVEEESNGNKGKSATCRFFHGIDSLTVLFCLADGRRRAGMTNCAIAVYWIRSYLDDRIVETAVRPTVGRGATVQVILMDGSSKDD